MPGDQKLYKQMMSKGHSAAWDMEWQKAAGYYRQALEEFPSSMQAAINLAAAYFELGDFPAALEQYRKVVVRSPNDLLVLEKIAQIFELQGQQKAAAETTLRIAEIQLKNEDVQKALENWQRTVRLDPGNLRARSRLALHYEKNSQPPQAVAQYLVIASLLQHEGNRERALEILQHAGRLLPNSNEVREALGLVRASQMLPLPETKPARREVMADGSKSPPQLPDAAGDRGKAADPISSAEKRALAALAGMVFDTEDRTNGRREGRDLQSITMGTGPLNRIHVNQTRIMMHLSQAVDLQAREYYRQAAEELERAVTLGLDNAAVFFDLGLLHDRDRSDERAVRNLKTSVKHEDYALASRLLLGKIFRRMDRLHDSAVQYLEALRLADAAAVAPDQRSGMLHAYEPLIEAYSNRSDETGHEHLVQRIDELLVQETWLDKVRQLRQQLAVAPAGYPPFPVLDLISEMESSQVVDMLAHIHDLTQKGLFRIAMEEAFTALDYAPTYLPLHTYMGEILVRQDRVPDAITKFSAVARAYSARGEAERSIELFRRITQMAPLDLSARQSLIEQLTVSGRMVETVQEVLELGDVYYRLAELDRARETYQRALSLAQQAKISREWTVEILHHLADIDLQRLDWNQAVKIFEQIARIDPGDHKAAVGLIDLNFRMLNDRAALAALGNYLAYLNRNGRQHEALETLETMTTNDPENIQLKRALAEQYEQAGNRQRAIQIWDEIGNRLLEEGDAKGARQAIEAILALNPPNLGKYRMALEKLQNGKIS